MISKDDIKKLADLARIEIGDEEASQLAGDMDSILGYVGQVSAVAGEMKEGVELGPVFNVMREDGDPTPPGTHTDVLLAEAPETKDGYLKVKKIL